MATTKKKPLRQTPATTLTTGGVQGAISVFKRKYKLTFKEGKPTVYKLQIQRGPVVKGDDLIAYASNAAHVPASTMRTAVSAIFQAVNYFCTQGHLVHVPQLGGFSLKTRVKSAQTLAETSTDNIKQKYLAWFPLESVAKLGRMNNISIVENKTLSDLAIRGNQTKAPDTPTV